MAENVMQMPKVRQYYTYDNMLGDGNVLVNELGIDEQRKLICNKYLIFATDIMDFTYYNRNME